MAGLLDFAARFGSEERCIEHLAGLRWPGGFVWFGLPRAGGLAAEGSTAGLRVRHLPPAGVGDRGNGFSSDADGSDEVVSCRLSDGSRQARRLGQISAAGTGGCGTER